MPLVISSSRRQPPVDYYTQPNIMISRSTEYVMGSGLDGEWLGPFDQGSVISNSAGSLISDDNDNWMRSVGSAQGNARTYLNTATDPDRLSWEENNVDTSFSSGGLISYDKTVGRWLFAENASDTHYSTDRGDNWNAGGASAAFTNGAFNDRHHVMVTTGGLTQVFLAGQTQMQYTEDGGDSWTSFTSAGWTTGSMSYNPFDDNIWVTYNGTSFQSRRGAWYLPRTNLGGSWTQSLNTEETYSIDVNTLNGTICVTSTDPDRVWRKPLGGSWSSVDITPVGRLQNLCHSPQVNRWFAWDTSDRQIWVSDDDGETWAEDTTFPPFSSNTQAYIEHRTRATMHDF